LPSHLNGKRCQFGFVWNSFGLPRKVHLTSNFATLVPIVGKNTIYAETLFQTWN
jgi:hypothetical protein